MQINQTQKKHIGLFGETNAGKSTLFNEIIGFRKAVVSNQAGTTTDPVKKSMEWAGVGAVVWVDSAGWNDGSCLEHLRMQQSIETLKEVDLAIIIFHEKDPEKKIIEQCKALNTPFLLLYTKADKEKLNFDRKTRIENECQSPVCSLSVFEKTGLQEFYDVVRQQLSKQAAPQPFSLQKFLPEESVVILVTPIDEAAPVGRMILPQVQMLRHLLDLHGRVIFTQPQELSSVLQLLKRAPDLVITDSQAFSEVNQIIPPEVPLTGFSMLLAYEKGPFSEYLKGTKHIDNLKNGDRILILESCTHEITCEDIGRVKLPRMLKQHTGKDLHFDYLSGKDTLPRPPQTYAMAIQCGGCVVTSKQLKNHLQPLISAGVPVSNYGCCMAFLSGMFTRTTSLFLSFEP